MIAPATIDAVKERADIVALVSEVVTLRKAGRSYLGLCPFHSERTPSFSVNPANNRWCCFGCGEKGGAIDFVMRNEGLSFPEAVRELADRLAIDFDEGTPQEREAAERERSEKDTLYKMNALAAGFYERALWGEKTARGSAYALEELDNRGLGGRPGDEGPIGAALAAFRIGYAPAAWRGLTGYLERMKLSLAPFVRAGLIIAQDGKRPYDRFRHRLMFPVIDAGGRVVAFSGRTLPAPEARDVDEVGFRMEEKPAKYVNSPETAIYSKGGTLFGLWQARDAARTRGEVLLVEGNFDVVALHARGLGHAIAPLGTAFTEAQARLMRKYVSAVVIAFDGDDAGRKATYEARVAVRAGRLQARAVALPKGSDPDSFVRRAGAAALDELVKNAPGLQKLLIDWLLSEGAEGGHAATALRVNAVVKLLGEEQDSTMRGLSKSYADALAGQLTVAGRAPLDLRDLELKLRQAMRKSQDGDAPVSILPLEDPLGFEIVGAIVDVPGIAARPEVAAIVELLDGDVALAARAAQHASVDDVIEGTPETLRPHMERRLAAPIHANGDAAAGAVLANGEHLRARRHASAEDRLRREIGLAEAAGDEDAVDRLLGELGRAVAVYL